MNQPNIIFIQADQLAAKQLHCYGGCVPSSPTLDRLAREGMRYDRCYSTFPVCLPNRASMLTGRSPGIHGLISGKTILGADSPCYAQDLAAAGYRVGGFGKFHREGTSGPHPRHLDDLGFHDYALVEDDKRGPYLEWIRDEHPEYYPMALGRLGKCKGYLNEEEQDLRQKARAEIFAPLKEATQYSHMFPSPFPSELHDSTWITNHALDFMQRHRKERKNEPFFCQVSYVDPHDPYDPPKPYDTMFAPEDMPEPLPAEFLTQGPAVMNTYNFLNCKTIRDENPSIFRKAAALYHGSVRFLDDQIARLIRYLEEHGMAANTIVVFTTDHGDLMGDHGLMAKFVHYDGSVRNPLIAWGGGAQAGVSDRLICALDFYPTFCDFAGVESDTRPPLEGKSFAASCQGDDDLDLWNEIAISSEDQQSVITDDGWRLTRWLETDAGQMFNLREDPGEQQNLYDEHSLAGKKLELLERLISVGFRPNQIPSYRSLNPLHHAEVLRTPRGLTRKGARG